MPNCKSKCKCIPTFNMGASARLRRGGTTTNVTNQQGGCLRSGYTPKDAGCGLRNKKVYSVFG